MRLLNLGNIAINQYLLEIQGGYMMIDTGYSDGYEKFKSQLQKHSIKITDIKYIFVTHAHDDHVGFLKEMLADNPEIIVFLSKESAERLSEGQNRFVGGTSSLYAHFVCGMMGLFGKSDHRFPAISKLAKAVYIDEPEFDFAAYGIDAKVVTLAGHTNDSVGLIVEGKYLLCGDAAMSGPASRHNNILYIESKENYILSWQKMIALDVTTIYPGHGKQFRKERLIKNYKHLDKIKLRTLKH